VAEPAATAVTTPFAETVASSGAALLHEMVRPVRTVPEASRSTALAWVDWPTDNDCEARETATVATGAGNGASTPIAALALFPSTVATIVALPVETPVTRPSFATVATVGLDDDHVGTRDVSKFPDASYTDAESASGCPTCT